MAKPGPKPKPTRLKVLTGNPGNRPLPKDEPQPEAGLPRCPTRFKGDARKLWQAFAKQLTSCKIATKLDASALELLIDRMMEYHTATAQVQRSGMVWLERGDGTIPKFAYSPYWVQQQRAFKAILLMLREFGMTPSSRSSIKTAEPLMQHSEDPASRYFG